MTQDKKDLTRIEDMGEFFHEDSSEESFLTQETLDNAEANQVPSLPDLPPGEEEQISEELNFSSEPEVEIENSGVEEIPTEPAPEEDQWQMTSDPFENAAPSEEITFAETPTEEIAEEGPKEPVQQVKTTAPQFNPTPSEPIFPKTEDLEIPVQDEKPYESPLKDLTHFAEKMDLSELPAESNPSFSLIVDQIKFSEEAEAIVEILQEYEIFHADLDHMKKSVKRGSLLIPRVNEYIAVTLLHKLRRFNVNLKVGLADLVHPSKHLEPDLGLVSKTNLTQNQSHHFNFEHDEIEPDDVILNLGSHLEGFEIIQYSGVVSESMHLDSHLVEEEHSQELMKIYHDLSEKLKPHAQEHKGNAIMGIQFQIQPVKDHYKLVCSGNVAIVKKL